MKRALISDIHSNIEALEAVLADIGAKGSTRSFAWAIWSATAPIPARCIDRVMDCKVCLLGNHDQGALFDPEGFNSGAERAIFWTRNQLENGGGTAAERQRRWDFLGELPRNYQEGKLLFVHGSARNPLNEYVFPEDIYNRRKLEKIFALIQRYAFQGHTHVPGVFTEDFQFYSPEELNHEYRLGDEKAMINVGSVGQPRDGNPQACYVVLEDDLVRFRRVEYPVEKTIAKIYDIPELDNFLGDRLRDGRRSIPLAIRNLPRMLRGLPQIPAVTDHSHACSPSFPVGELLLFVVLTFDSVRCLVLDASTRRPQPSAQVAAGRTRRSRTSPAEKAKAKPGREAGGEAGRRSRRQAQEKPAEEAAEKPPAKVAAGRGQAKLPRRWVTLGSADPDRDPYRMLVTLSNRGAAWSRIELSSSAIPRPRRPRRLPGPPRHGGRCARTMVAPCRSSAPARRPPRPA